MSAWGSKWIGDGLNPIIQPEELVSKLSQDEQDNLWK
jgi:hypothetical protein